MLPLHTTLSVLLVPESVKKISPHFMEPTSSVQFPQQFPTGPYLQPHYPVHAVPIYLKSTLILSSQLLLGLPSQALYAFPLPVIRAFLNRRQKSSKCQKAKIFSGDSKNFLGMPHFQID
jgi:hypothetical protein